MERIGAKTIKGKGGDDSNKKNNLRSLLYHLIAENSGMVFGF